MCVMLVLHKPRGVFPFQQGAWSVTSMARVPRDIVVTAHPSSRHHRCCRIGRRSRRACVGETGKR